MNIDAEYKRYVEHWGDPIDPINYKLYSIETDMPCFHPDNRLFTKEEFREQLEKVSPQDTPAICEYSGLRPVEGYKEEIEDKLIDKETEIRDIDFMYKWIREKSGK